jgi:tripartite-type tricarboxylate transporter receptor subunit TctC
MLKSSAAAALLALIAASPLPALAQVGPSRGPIHFIVPYPRGGSTDVGARFIDEHLSRALGQQVVVENKSGASGNIGFEAGAKSAPHVFKVNFDPLKDLVAVVQLSRQPVVLAAHPKLGVNSLAELIALVKQQPGLSYATSGVGSQQHMTAAWFAKLADIKLEHVPYRGGGQAINDLIAVHITLASLGSTPLIPHYKAGKLKLLAQSTAQRSPSLPDVPTYQQAGINLQLDQWLGVFVPAGTPAAVTARLNAEINKALATPAVRDVFVQSAQEPIGGSAEQFSQLVRNDFARYEKLTKELNITAN